MSNYELPPNYLVSEIQNGNVITITQPAVPTVLNYDYFNGTVYVTSEPQPIIIGVSTTVSSLTVY